MSDKLLDAQFRSDLTRIRAHARAQAEREAEERRARESRRAEREARLAERSGWLARLYSTGSALASALPSFRRRRGAA